MSEYCKLCGEHYSNAKSLLGNRCPKNPMPNGKHVLFEGDQDGPFFASTAARNTRLSGHS